MEPRKREGKNDERLLIVTSDDRRPEGDEQVEDGGEGGGRKSKAEPAWPEHGDASRMRVISRLRTRRRRHGTLILTIVLEYLYPACVVLVSTWSLSLSSSAMSTRSSFQNSANRPSSAVPSLAAVADPSPRYVDGAAMDYFVIEMVNTLRASSAVATARAKKVEQEMIEAGLMPTPATVPPALKGSQLRQSHGSDGSRDSISRDGKDEDEELRARLEAIGVHVGANMAERYACAFLSCAMVLTSSPSLCHDRGLFADTLDAIKFICKDLWSACWEKQVDNLRTNHRVRCSSF